MSIRLRFTLLYNVLLALTLGVFGVALYSIQSQTTYDALKKDLIRSSESTMSAVVRAVGSPEAKDYGQEHQDHPPLPFESFTSDQEFQKLPEREIVRVLDAQGNLVASPFGRSVDVLPLSEQGLQALIGQQDWWETGVYQEQRLLIYSRPLLSQGQVVYILQVARPLTERDRSLQVLATTLLVASGVTLVVAFGIGLVLSEVTLKPIQRITHTAQQIGNERDFTHRVVYHGPPDEVGQLAMTFNTMLARLQDAYEQVAHALEMQRSFVADVSHELRTPLTTLRGNLALLLHKPSPPVEEQEDILHDMVDESDRLIRLATDLLVAARAEATVNGLRHNLARTKVEALPVLEETCRQARTLDPQRAITCRASTTCAFLGDRDAFKQVMLILLDNAIKHSTGAVDVFAEAAGAVVRVVVSDQGPGIPAEKLAHVFDRFYRSDDGWAIQGFGLGLPIARQLIEGQGGTIELESQEGQGSQVVICLPRST